uniref:glutathione transferase n=1 Tax=Candidatus Kentrum sp. TUN TaxID=2126343 RepID=A0A451A2L6_9GAMM|nr:MAG: glutathione S-transferase [Candidatus Kentron sp. TUN]VFK60271.1 MAG: glutathione S-transferase [Candidatus Kentron sp. TUN]VFK61709.1 MAG: glutathione S-transferase [Candidatus Kentron sp. TUN]
MELELISFKLCPFVQRALITLLHKKIPYKTTYIDIGDPPLWFLQISPFGKVPVLKVAPDKYLFESAVICEYIDETTHGQLLPEDPFLRARNRGWIEFGSACIMDSVSLLTAKTESDFEDRRDELEDKFERIEDAIDKGPFFNGAKFSLVDAAYAPLLMRLALLRQAVDIFTATTHPKVNAWSETLLALPAVRNSVVKEFPDLYLASIQKRKGYIASLLSESTTDNQE